MSYYHTESTEPEDTACAKRRSCAQGDYRTERKYVSTNNYSPQKAASGKYLKICMKHIKKFNSETVFIGILPVSNPCKYSE